MDLDLESRVRHLLDRTGIGAQLLSEAEQARAEEFADLARQKAASLAKFIKARPAAEKSVAEAEAAQAAAQAAAEAAMREWIKSRAMLEQVIGDHAADLDRLHPAMRRCAHPGIAQLRAELVAHRERGAALVQAPGADGKRLAQAGADARRVLEVLDELTRLEVSHDHEAVPAALASLRARVGVTP